MGAVNFQTHSEDELSSVLGDEADGGIAICDEGGVVVIPKDAIDLVLSKKLHHIEALEDLWHYCLNTLKWSTYDIVVRKRYLEEGQDIPISLLESIRSLEGK